MTRRLPSLETPELIHRAEEALVAYRQLDVIFNPWNSGHTTVSVVTADYRGNRRLVHRIGSIDLPVGRQALTGRSPADVTAHLIAELHKWLSERRPTLDGPQGLGVPLGTTGGTVPLVPGQLSLDLDLTV